MNLKLLYLLVLVYPFIKFIIAVKNKSKDEIINNLLSCIILILVFIYLNRWWGK